MDDECCVMEEKSIFGRLYVEGRTNENDGLTECNCKTVGPSENAAWLPDGLRKRMSQSFENVRQRRSYPVIDWLKEIRLSCDLYDVGSPMKDYPEVDSASNEEQWTSEESEDFNDVESIAIDERSYVPINESSHVDCENLHDIRCETHLRDIDNAVALILQSEEARNELTQSRCDDSSGNDESFATNQEVTTVSYIFDENNALGTTIGTTDSPNVTCCFELQPINDKHFDVSRSIELCDILFCSDDDRALKYCDLSLGHGNVLSDDFEKSNSQSKSRNSERDQETTNVDHGCLRCASLGVNLAEIDDTLLATNFENNLSGFRAKDKQFDEADVSFDEFASNVNLMERFNDFEAIENVARDTELEERFCDSFNDSEDNKYSDYEIMDFTIINRNLDSDCKMTTMPVVHWIEAFNNLNTLKEGTQSTDRIPIDTFNIFDGVTENNSDVTRELCHEETNGRSNDWCDAGVDFDKSVGENDALGEYRRRKGSVSSDIVAWKRNLWDKRLDDEETRDQWFSSNDLEGKIYFFEENSNESSWLLPTVQAKKSLSINVDGKSDKIEANGGSTSEQKEGGSSTRTSVLANPSIASRDLATKKPGPTSGDWPHLYDGNNMLFLKEGIINRTKITENGKKLRKNWSTSYAVLTELFLLFFKDAKTFTMMKTGQSSMAKPDISVDLNGALVEHGERASSRKNVYMISTVLGLQVLIQSDNTAVATEWFQEVHGAIRKLPSGFKSQGKLLSIAAELRSNSGNKQTAESNQPEDPKKFSKIARSRSMKMKRLDDSLEDLSASAAERQTKIKAKLRWFFQRRPAVELLVKNGIYKDEPAFGSYLSDVCPTEPPRVPLFVKTCIEVLESKEENMKTDGLYRASGNLSQIQKIRLQVDQYKLDVLAQEEDVHVLAGALKLFFRELKEPLIPSTFFKEAVNASMAKKNSAKIQSFRDIVKALPPPNYDTLQFLLKHLLRVTSYQEFNRMHIPNLAIVFGPTLMWPAEESVNMALDFMQQNLVIECLLSEYNKIFK